MAVRLWTASDIQQHRKSRVADGRYSRTDGARTGNLKCHLQPSRNGPRREACFPSPRKYSILNLLMRLSRSTRTNSKRSWTSWSKKLWMHSWKEHILYRYMRLAGEKQLLHHVYLQHRHRKPEKRRTRMPSSGNSRLLWLCKAGLSYSPAF